MKTAILGNKSSVMFFLVLGVSVFFVENDEECRSELIKLLKNDFKLIYITENFFEALSGEVDDLQGKYEATIVFIPGKGESLNLGNKMLEICAERATGSTACLR